MDLVFALFTLGFEYLTLTAFAWAVNFFSHWFVFAAGAVIGFGGGGTSFSDLPRGFIDKEIPVIHILPSPATSSKSSFDLLEKPLR